MSSPRKHIWIIIICVLGMLLLVGVAPSYGWRLRGILNPQGIVATNDPSLVAQNQSLQAQVAQCQDVQLPQLPTNAIPAMVYSRYPLDFKNQFLINVGSNDGVVVGKAVIYKGIFIGLIQKVFSDSSLVQTVFDPGIKLPVRIGTHAYDGLLMGGADPKATSITKNSMIAVGDIIVTAAPGSPYGLPIATVAATTTSADSLFEEASLSFGYDINTIDAVLVER
jgi:rod shape-determining protein MreC